MEADSREAARSRSHSSVFISGVPFASPWLFVLVLIAFEIGGTGILPVRTVNWQNARSTFKRYQYLRVRLSRTLG